MQLRLSPSFLLSFFLSLSPSLPPSVCVCVCVCVDHVVIHVSDWERSNAFYRDVLGAELVERDGGPAPPLPLRRPAAERPRPGPGPDARGGAARRARRSGSLLRLGRADRGGRGHLEAHGVDRRGGAGHPLRRPRRRARASTSAIPTAACSSSSPTHEGGRRAIARGVPPPPWSPEPTGSIRYRPPRWILLAPFDHPAHLATAALIALNLPSRSPRWDAGFMAGRCCPMWTTSRWRSPSSTPRPTSRGRHPLPAGGRPAVRAHPGLPQRAPRRSRRARWPTSPATCAYPRAPRCSGPFARTTCSFPTASTRPPWPRSPASRPRGASARCIGRAADRDSAMLSVGL